MSIDIWYYNLKNNLKNKSLLLKIKYKKIIFYINKNKNLFIK